MVESRGRSAGLLSRVRGSRGELQLLPRLMGEKRPQSAVLGVVRVGVVSSPGSPGDLRALSPTEISLKFVQVYKSTSKNEDLLKNRILSASEQRKKLYEKYVI